MNPSIQKSFYTLLVMLFTSCFVIAQECTLDIGGKNDEMIISIFQLNDDQKATLEMLGGELNITQKAIEEDIQKLFDTQPQETEAELIALSDKYKLLKEKMVNASWQSDKKLLETFNAKQYDRYLSLCHEAVRIPIKITPISYRDSSSPE